MRKIVVIGCGNVGIRYVENVVLEPNLEAVISLIDLDENKMKGEVLDLEQALTLKTSSILLKVGDYEDCEDADLVVLTAGLAQSTNNRLNDLMGANKIIESVVKKVMQYHFKGIFLVASNPLDVMTQLTAYYADYPYEKVIGTGTMLDSARLQSILSKRLGIAPCSVTAYVLGEHGNSQFVAWNNANVGLQNLQTLLTKEEKDQVEAEVRNMGETIIRLKGHTEDGIAACLVRLSMLILTDEKRIYPVSCYQPDYDVYLSTPAVIGKDGIEKMIEMKLTESEEAKLAASAKVIKEAVQKILPAELY